MKQGTNYSLPVVLGVDLADVEKVEIIFRKGPSVEADAIKLAVYPGDVTAKDENTLLVPNIQLYCNMRVKGAKRVIEQWGAAFFVATQRAYIDRRVDI